MVKAALDLSAVLILGSLGALLMSSSLFSNASSSFRNKVNKFTAKHRQLSPVSPLSICLRT